MRGSGASEPYARRPGNSRQAGAVKALGIGGTSMTGSLRLQKRNTISKPGRFIIIIRIGELSGMANFEEAAAPPMSPSPMRSGIARRRTTLQRAATRRS